MFSYSDRRHQRTREPLEVADKFALAASFGALRESAVFLDGLPLLRDEAERRRAVLDSARFNEPAADDEARAADAATAVHGGDTPAARVVPEHGEDLAHVRLGAGQGAVWYREGVVLDVAQLDAADARDVRGEVWRVRRELPALRQVDERPHARAQQQIELLRALGPRRRPGVLACYQQRRRPVRVGERPWPHEVIPHRNRHWEGRACGGGRVPAGGLHASGSSRGFGGAGHGHVVMR